MVSLGLVPLHLVEDGVEILLDEVDSLGLDEHERDCMTVKDCERDLKIEQAKTKWLNKEMDDLNDYLNLLAHIIYDHKF